MQYVNFVCVCGGGGRACNIARIPLHRIPLHCIVRMGWVWEEHTLFYSQVGLSWGGVPVWGEVCVVEVGGGTVS